MGGDASHPLARASRSSPDLVDLSTTEVHAGEGDTSRAPNPTWPPRLASSPSPTRSRATTALVRVAAPGAPRAFPSTRRSTPGSTSGVASPGTSRSTPSSIPLTRSRFLSPLLASVLGIGFNFFFGCYKLMSLLRGFVQSLDEAHSSPGLHAAAGSGLAEECATLVLFVTELVAN